MTLAARSLAFGYPGRVVGRALDLELAAGEILCVLGPNGAGKTTLFRTLLGLIPALGGEARIAGRPMRTLSRAAIAREVAYVPQASAPAFDFTLLETVEMGRAAHLGPFGAPGKRDGDIALQSLARLGIARLAHRPMHSVSEGERSLALIARALATQAGTLVMDEPTASLDFGNQARVLEEISRLRGSGIGVLLCTHAPDHARIADRVLLLAGGSILAQGPVAQTLTAGNLTRLYGVPVQVSAEGVISSAARGVSLAGDGW